MDNELMSMTMVSSYNQYFCQRYYHWQQENQPSSVVATLPVARAMQFPKASRKTKLLSDKDQQELKVRRMIRNRESAARSRARKLAFIKELQNKVSQLEALIKSLGGNKEFNLKELHSVSQEETRPQLRRTNSAPR